MGRTPWALLTAVAILVAAEAAVRAQEPSTLIPYENTGRNAYSALRDYLDAYGPAEVSFVGSSRGREAIVVPEVRRLLEESLGRDVRVANYSSPAAAADEVAQITRLILRQETKPRFIVYGVSPLQVARKALRTTHSGELWYLRDWWREQRRNPQGPRILGVVPDYDYHLLPEVIRNDIALHCKTFAYREKIALVVRELTSEYEQAPCPINGELTEKQVVKPDLSIAQRPIRDRRVQRYLRKRMRGGEYPIGGRQTQHVEEIIRMCEDAGVQLIFYEIPLAGILVEHMPEGTVEETRDIVGRLAEAHDVPFARVSDLETSFGEGDFREQSHMNLPGAARLSRLLAERVILPRYSRESPPPTEAVAGAKQ